MRRVEDEPEADRGDDGAARRGLTAGEHPAPGWTRRRLLRAAGTARLGLGGAALLAACGAARPTGQQPRHLARIGFLSGNVAPGSPETEAFRQGLRALGYVEGRNAAIEWRFAERDDQLPQRAAELVGLRLAALVTAGTPATQAAKQATSTIPIVAAAIGDPANTGLVASIARPGGSVTGVRSSMQGLNAKRLEFLNESFPAIERVAVLGNPANPVVALQFVELEEAAPQVGVTVERLEVRAADEFAPAFARAEADRPDGLVGLFDGLTLSHRGEIVAFAAHARLPAIYALRDFVDAGGLMTYSPKFPDMYRRAATYVDKILKGARPADLPVERPRRFSLVVNMGSCCRRHRACSS
ncbi:MAG TPA: ABC transporter substrate-binding protein [Chloroflexota bacterium]|jgi:putative ABC transport system substrate-binding protein